MTRLECPPHPVSRASYRRKGYPSLSSQLLFHQNRPRQKYPATDDAIDRPSSFGGLINAHRKICPARRRDILTRGGQLEAINVTSPLHLRVTYFHIAIESRSSHATKFGNRHHTVVRVCLPDAHVHPPTSDPHSRAFARGQFPSCQRRVRRRRRSFHHPFNLRPLLISRANTRQKSNETAVRKREKQKPKKPVLRAS